MDTGLFICMLLFIIFSNHFIDYLADALVQDCGNPHLSYHSLTLSLRNTISIKGWRHDQHKMVTLLNPCLHRCNGCVALYLNLYDSITGLYNEDFGVRSRHQGHGLEITSHRILWYVTFSHALGTCFWHQSPLMRMVIWVRRRLSFSMSCLWNALGVSIKKQMYICKKYFSWGI